MFSHKTNQMIKHLLSYPGTFGLDLDHPSTTVLRREILRQKQFLRSVYKDWYYFFKENCPDIPGKVLEIGSGAGFLDELIPELIRSDISFLEFNNAVINACHLPFQADSLRAILMVNVFHHIPDVTSFLHEAGRCIVPGGTILLIEPWNTSWSKLIYKYLHHEPFLPDAIEWALEQVGPLSGGNDALPWIVFSRDRQRFCEEFQDWKIELIRPFCPFRYLLSGGMSLRSLAPHWSYSFWYWLENQMDPVINQWGMFAQIIIRKV